MTLVISPRKLDQKIFCQLKKIKQDFFLEIRLDLIKIKDIRKFKKDLPKKLIFTLKNNLKDLDELLLLKPTYIDVDYDVKPFIFEKIKNKAKIIASYHDFEKTPSLEEIFLKMQRPNVDCYKIATFASSSLDSLTMLEFVLQKAKKGYNICGLCMGEKGKITRILAKVVGSYFTYAKIDAATAEGQIDFDILEKRYRYSSLNKNTTIYALLGGDTSLSVSDIFHNKVFAREQKNSVYVKIDLLKEELSGFFEKIKTLPFKGFSVTMPLKEEVAKFFKKDFPVNTLVKKDTWKCFNTDGIGAVKALEEKVKLDGKTVLILGAGGAGRAIALAVRKKRANVIILNRSKEKALLIAKELNILGGALKDIAKFARCDIIINATASLDPIDEEFLCEKTVAFDIHTRPQMTQFLKKALLKKCRVIFGSEMFVYQAEEQQRIWNT